ncbi:MAG: glycosyltransferase family 4 protein [Deltaproteobacteria bacterium]|nr:glycosyltransferase family 4 protein [Deltaproteobacteria bacterium]
MRILHLVSYSLYSGPLPPTVGLALAQRDLGHEVYLAYDSKRGAFNDFEEPAAPKLAVANLQAPWHFTLSAKSNFLEFWRDFYTLRKSAKQGSLDIVHVHLSHDHLLAALALSSLHSLACVRTIHAERSLHKRFGQAFLHRRAAAWITRADIHREKLIKQFSVDANKVAVIPSGFNAIKWPHSSAAKRAELRQHFLIPDNTAVVAHVALIAKRGQKELVSALALIAAEQRPVVLFVGRGEGEADLHQHIAKLQMQPWVRFAGYLKGQELENAYQCADVCFLAQPGNDASARAILEAMAAQVAVVAVASGAIGELVTKKRGYPIISRDPDVIKQGILAALQDPQRSKRIEDARQYVLNERSFTNEALATIDLYQRTLKKL